ncbi:MAG: glycosyltransferase family 2 protein [Sphingobium sp.]|nr:glycosyltransferase family 2 protein [Sphingobium sp.]
MRHFAIDTYAIQPVRALELSVIVPTLNEKDNAPRLFERLAIALAGIEWEAIFVDDGSRDGTAEVVEGLARDDRRARLIRRVGRRGLSSAVMEGMLSSTAPVVAVIDADLQHDEAILPDLYAAVASGEKDIAIGTRYAAGGSIGDWASHRARISGAATRLAGLVIKTPLSDPMSGFFAVRRDIVLDAAPRVTGIGYKVLLDLVASVPRTLAVAEIPYRFRSRDTGESKLDSMVALEYLELLLEKSVGRWVPVRFLQFACVGALGLGVHLAMLAAATQFLGAGFALGQTIAVLSAMTFNFTLNNRFTYRDRRLKGWRFLTGLLSFSLVCSLGAVANIGVGSLLFAQRESWWVAGAAGAVIGSVWNYVMGSLITWRKK